MRLASRALALALFAGALFPAPAHGNAPLLLEREPNDSAAAARHAEAPVRITGALTRGDVDVFLLDVDDDAAAQLFGVTLDGPGGAAVTVTLTASAAKTPLVTLSSGKDRPSVSAPRVLLAPDTYTLEVRGGPGPYVVGVAARPLRPVALVAGKPRERADVVRDVTEDAAFVLPSGDAWLRWSPPAGRYDIGVAVMGGAAVTLALLDPAGNALGTTRGAAPALAGVEVARGHHHVQLNGPEGTLVVLSLQPSGAATAGPAAPPPLVLGQPTVGQLAIRGEAAYRFYADGSAPLHRVTASGAGLRELLWVAPSGQRLAAVRATGSGAKAVAAFESLVLPEGEHRFAVRGGPGDFRLLVEAVKLPPTLGKAPSLEREPNDHATFADDLRFGAPRVGFATTASDVDVFRVHVPLPQAVRLTVTPSTLALKVRVSADGAAVEQWQVEPGAPLVFRGHLPAGDLQLDVTPVRASEAGAAYVIALEHDDPFDTALVEPNDRAGDARPLPADLVARGVGDGADWFVLPRLARETAVKITPDVNARVHVYAAGKPSADLVKREAGGYAGRLPADTEVFLEIAAASGGPYVAPIVFEGGPAPAARGATPAEVAVRLVEDTAAAYARTQQTLHGEVVVTGQGDGVLALEARTTDPRWRVTLAQARVAVSRGKPVTVPFTLQVAPDARGDRPVRVDVGARAADSGASWVSGHAVAVARGGAPEVRPEVAWPLPDALLGGVDVARGGTFVDAAGKPTDPGRRVTALIAGFARPDQRFEVRLEPGATRESMPTVRLRGDRQARVAGVVLEAVGSDLRSSLRDFRVWLSLDGQRWEEAVAGTLEAREGEQAFVLAAPRDARFVRLELLSNHERVPAVGPGQVSLGTLKVIADPTAPVVRGAGPDLAAAEEGAHIAYMAPHEDNRRQVTLLAGQRFEAVFGFHAARAARLVELGWQDPPKAASPANLASVTFYGSTRGPVGPWTKLGERTATGVVALPAAPWVRYVKVESAPAAQRGRYNVPVLVAREQEAGADYRSVLGEWGPFRRAAGFERAHPEPPPAPATAKGHQSRKSAFRIGKEAVTGRVHRGRVEDWYAVAVAAGHPQLVLRADGQPTLDADFELSDAQGGLVQPRHVDERPGSSERSYEVTPGKTYYVRVWQPPSSVIFSWDTSGSVAGWVPLVRNAVQRFAETVTPGQERIHLLPFGGGPLLADWEERTTALWNALATYTPAASSESEMALSLSARLLGETRGAKAVVLLTDALSPVDPTLWKALADVQPRVFTAGVAAGLGGEGQDRLESWASVNAGYYDGVTSRGQLDVFFDRAATWLRQPASYSLQAVTTPQPLAPPGTLEVVDGGQRAGQGDAVEFVVDVSGSMLEKMRGGGTRIDVARRILAETVTRDVPAGTSVALRVFGRVGGDACGTELSVPVGPADAVLAAIAGIDAKKYAMTPIAAALAQVATDLAAVPGRKTVVLVTDGRETCGGNPAKVLDELDAQGLGVRVNVVGFALTSASLKRTFAALADKGGGEFYDAADGESLAAVMTAAVRAAFVVRGPTGAVVARGTVGGEPVSLPAGVYRVEVATSPPLSFEDVEVKDGENCKLSLKAP